MLRGKDWVLHPETNLYNSALPSEDGGYESAL